MCAPILSLEPSASTSLASPDGALRVVAVDGDVVLGFDGVPWRTHADILQATYHGGAGDMVERWVADLAGGRPVIAVCRVGDTILGVCVTDDPAATAADRFRPAKESIERRLWDGTRVHP